MGTGDDAQGAVAFGHGIDGDGGLAESAVHVAEVVALIDHAVLPVGVELDDHARAGRFEVELAGELFDGIAEQGLDEGEDVGVGACGFECGFEMGGPGGGADVGADVGVLLDDVADVAGLGGGGMRGGVLLDAIGGGLHFRDFTGSEEGAGDHVAVLLVVGGGVGGHVDLRGVYTSGHGLMGGDRVVYGE